MGGCCRKLFGECWPTQKEDDNHKIDDSATQGPVENRRCTDIVCLPLFIAAQVLFIIITCVGCSDGDPTKLYKPRDYRGAYCGTKENWNGGPNTDDAKKLSFTMNVTETINPIMLQLVCSSVSKKALVDGDSASGVAALLTDPKEVQEYLCDCCLSPCSRCDGSLEKSSDLKTIADLSKIKGRMNELTNLASGKDLFDPAGFNEDLFSSNSFWQKATDKFNQVCLTGCDVDYRTIEGDAEQRDYTYLPFPDTPFSGIWEKLKQASSTLTETVEIKKVINDDFSFKALPTSACPYPADLCVPFPGVEYEKLAGIPDYCAFKLSDDVVEILGKSAVAIFEGLGDTSIAEGAAGTFGKWFGDFQETVDTFIIVSTLSFVVGLIFLVVLRFFIGICVWISALVSVLLFFLAGSALYVVSKQCEGAGIWQTGKQMAVAVVVSGTNAASNAINGQSTNEHMDPNKKGTDYRGHQRHTVNGRSCAKWDEQTLMPDYNSVKYPAADINDKRYCRNPVDLTVANALADTFIADTIWCVTTEPDVPWEECKPIGVINPKCEHGYEIKSGTWRDVLFVCAIIIWSLGGIWFIVLLCLVQRIRLAIALNKVGAVFLAGNPQMLLVPVFQVLLGILWALGWLYSASFLLSQVPEDYIPKGTYTYAEAYGTDDDPGVCTDKWPTGAVWRDHNCQLTDGTYRCYGCMPPRYVLDARFFVSFFVYLWNQAFNIAMGQLLIAMAVGIWFFSRSKGHQGVLKRSLYTIFRFHLGTAAFGSLIIAIIQFIRYMMMYLEKQAEAQKNVVMVYILKCVQCCIWCFEKCIKFLNKNAYIQTALMGTNFCTSAKKGFYLILRNPLRFMTVAALTWIVRWIGFMFIMAGTAVTGYFLVREMHDGVSPFLPVFLYVCVSYVSATLYMDVFGMAVDTALQCFLVVEETGKGYDVVPDVLQSFLDTRKGKQVDDQ